MVQIIIDTQKDSAQTIRQVINLLEQELRKKEPYTHPLTINQETIQESSSFTDMFAEQQTHTSPPIQQTSQQTDVFSMFSNELPSSGTRKTDTHAIPTGMHLPSFEEDQHLTNNFSNNYSQQNPLNDIDNLFVEKKPEPTDFEGSSRFAEFNQQSQKEDSSEKKQDFFKELEFYD
jgi:hypothetical protein